MESRRISRLRSEHHVEYRLQSSLAVAQGTAARVAWSLKDRVRPAHAGDARAVVHIFFDCLREHGFPVLVDASKSAVADFGSGVDPERVELVVVSAGRVSGFLILGPTGQPGSAEIFKVFVERSHRRRGVGTLLIDEAIRIAKERGYRELVLETHTAFVDARRYYERHGWTLMPHPADPAIKNRIYALPLWRSQEMRRARSHG